MIDVYIKDLVGSRRSIDEYELSKYQASMAVPSMLRQSVKNT